MIDWTRVKDLRSEIGENDFFEVVEMFFDETDEVVANLERTVDLATVESLLHFLKGSALNLGFIDLATLCQNGEKSAAQGRAEQVNLRDVTASYHLSKSELLTALGRSKAA